jgi:hypothetical protein
MVDGDGIGIGNGTGRLRPVPGPGISCVPILSGSDMSCEEK